MRFGKRIVVSTLLLTLLALSLSTLTSSVFAQTNENTKTVTIVVTTTTTFVPLLGSIAVWFGLGFVAGVIVMGMVVVLRSGSPTSSKRRGKKRR